MRIKEEIKRSGAFWLPTSPQRDIYGTLSISDGGNIKLELTQSIDTDLKAVFGQTEGLNQIVGHVEKDGPVLIDRCYRIEKKRNVAHGGLIAADVIWADRVLTSLPYDENATLHFNTFTFSIEGIDEWVGISGIKMDPRLEERALTISYNQPTEVSINLENGMQLLITFAYTIPGIPSTKKAEVTQKTYFKLISQETCELDEFISVAKKITSFLCFVMNEIVCLERMSATSENLQQDIGDGHTAPISVGVYCPTRPYAKDEPEINALDMLFRFTEVQDQFESIINKWIENYEQISPAIDLFFLTKTGTLPTWNIQFLTLVQSLEAFHRRTSDEKHMKENEFEEIRKSLIEKCPKNQRDWFRPKLQYANELTLKNRIQRLTDPFEKYMFGEKRSQMIRRIVNTRNYLTHYDLKSEPEAAKGQALKFLCHKMNALFRLHFLKLIGFNEQEIDHIVDKCPHFKGECKL